MAVKSSVIDRHRRSHTVGTIRLGDVKGEKHPGRPLYKFRLSSPDKGLIEQAAEVYGGEPRWVDHTKEWDLVTERTQLKAYVSLLPKDPSDPDGDLQSLTQWFYRRDKTARWTHKCDGVTCQFWQELPAAQHTKGKTKGLFKGPCQCDPENRRCELTTMLVVALTEIAASGTWKLTTKSATFDEEFNSFVEQMNQMGVSDVPVVLDYTKVVKNAAPGDTADSFPLVRVSVDQQPVNMPELFQRIRMKALAPQQSAIGPSGNPALESKKLRAIEAAQKLGGTEKDYHDFVELMGQPRAHQLIADALMEGTDWHSLMVKSGLEVDEESTSKEADRAE